MNVFRITRCDFVNDLSGQGAYLNGGRWNSEGFYALYTASTASLALLETLAHLKVIPQTGYCLACIKIPEDAILPFDQSLLPAHWNVYPAPIALQHIGDQFLQSQKFLAMELPSALLQEDKVILLNPKHPLFKEVKIRYSRPIDIDKRLYK
jgi:RES domain-containing protein